MLSTNQNITRRVIGILLLVVSFLLLPKQVEVYGTNYTPAGIPTEVWRSATRKTFFPDSWSEQKIIAEITHGFQNKVFQSTTPSNGSSIYLGTMSDGISVFIIVGSDGKIITAYPKI